MHILEKIVTHKKKEVALRKKQVSIEDLKSFDYYSSECKSVVDVFEQRPKNIIAEFKRKSPSKANINLQANLVKQLETYQNAGASAVSILTDHHFFGGSLEDLIKAKEILSIPILQKDFILDPYQVHEAKAHGADFILLIAKVLSIAEVQQLSTLAQDLGMEVLVEVHTAEELVKTNFTSINLIGVNNRNLENFETNIENSLTIAGQIPPEFVKISESGIYERNQIDQLYQAGFEGFLIGEELMKSSNVTDKMSELIGQKYKL